MARISAGPDGYRPRLERLHHRAAGRRRLSVGQKASHHRVRMRLPKRKPAVDVSSFGIANRLLLLLLLLLLHGEVKNLSKL